MGVFVKSNGNLTFLIILMGDFEVSKGRIVDNNVFIVDNNAIITCLLWIITCFMGGASRGVGLSFSIPIILY